MAAAVLSRGTPAAGVNPSQAQTSAPVHEYRCMFTHDVRKKAKKWHDGSLRFHTFNKRVMVYDDTKNLVGSLHYRSQEEFAEGLELNLDSHVLVQVEDQLGETNTDLTPILARQKPDGDDQRPDAPMRATLPRMNAAHTQIKPKSIKELLAGSQGQLGRARISVASPYEQRHPQIGSQSVQRDHKRRRIDNDKENDPRMPIAAKKPARACTGESRTQDRKIVDVSSGDESNVVQSARHKGPQLRSTPPEQRQSSSLARPVTTDAIKRKANSSETTSNKRSKAETRIRSAPSLPTSNRNEARTENPTKKGSSTRTGNDSPVQSLPNPPSASRASVVNSTSSVRLPSGPRSSLKFAPQKRRPRLMYRALLESSSKPQGSAEYGTVETQAIENAGLSDGLQQVSRRTRLTNLIEADQIFAPSQIDREANSPTWEALDHAIPSSPPSPHNLRQEKSPSPASAQADDLDASSPFRERVVETVPDSPLFLPRTASRPSPSQSHIAMADDTHFTSLSQALQHTTTDQPRTPPRARKEPISRVDREPEEASDPSSSPAFHEHLSERGKADEMIEVTGPRAGSKDGSGRSPSSTAGCENAPVISPDAPRSAVRLFRRVASENIPLARASPDLVSDDASSEEDFLNDMLDDSLLEKTSPRLRNPPTQPQSFSDPVDIHPKSPTPIPASSPPNVNNGSQHVAEEDVVHAAAAPETMNTANATVEESGPWTSIEAFLLFDRWPPGRQKPPFAKAIPEPANVVDAGDDGGRHHVRQKTDTNIMSKKKYGTFGSARFVSQR